MERLLTKMELYAAQYHVPIINAKGKHILTEIITDKKPHRVLEIGTAIGYSALLIAQNSADDVRLTTIELSKDRAEIAQSFIEESIYANQIEIIIGDAAKVLGTLEDCYDLVFIDAAKGQYVNYFYKVLPMLSDEAVIIADNVLFRGYVRSQEKPPRRYKTIVSRLREYIEIVTTHARFDTEIYENGDGLAVSYCRRKNIEKT